MKKLILFLILIISGKIVFALDNEDFAVKRPVNSIYINLLGDASIISINYERILSIDAPVIFTSKLGLGFNERLDFRWSGAPSEPPVYLLTIPYHITGNLGKGRHLFEIGMGGTIIIGNTNYPYLSYPIVGYRILPLRSNKINFRIYVQIPFSGLDPGDVLFIPFGFSLGRSF